jgi:hypothetical protein
VYGERLDDLSVEIDPELHSFGSFRGRDHHDLLGLVRNLLDPCGSFLYGCDSAWILHAVQYLHNCPSDRAFLSLKFGDKWLDSRFSNLHQCFRGTLRRCLLARPGTFAQFQFTDKRLYGGSAKFNTTIPVLFED